MTSVERSERTFLGRIGLIPGFFWQGQCDGHCEGELAALTITAHASHAQFSHLAGPVVDARDTVDRLQGIRPYPLRHSRDAAGGGRVLHGVSDC